MIQFPKGFVWGSSTSGPQTEGRISGDGKGDNLWDYWFSQEAHRFYNEIGPDKASTFYENWEQDIDLLVETGHTAFRTSIQWSRIFPDGRGPVNQIGVDFYRKVFERIKSKGIRLIVNLYHFDLPFALQEAQEGWESLDTVDAYVDYARFCFESYGDLVDQWVTFNEPIVPVEFGYFYDGHYPNKVDAQAAVKVAYHTQLASSLAVKACHEVGADYKIGIILNLTPAYPRSSNKEDIKAAKIAELFANKSFLDPAVIGSYPKELIDIIKKHDLMPIYSEDELEIIRQNTVDFLGINYYQPLRVKAKECMPNENAPFSPLYYYDIYDMPGKKINPYRGWEIYPKAIYDIAKNIQENYGNIKWFISENGMGVEGEERFKNAEGVIEDDYRIEFYREHLTHLHKAITEGANCFGYHTWTPIDCWSWTNAYKNRYGYISVDLPTQIKTIKKSGHWIKEVSESNEIEGWDM